MDTWLTLHGHLHWHLINTPSTSRSSSTKFLIDSYIHSLADYWPTVGQMWIVSIKYQSGCWLSAERDVDGGYQSRVSIDTQLRMLLLVNMIPLSLYSKYYSWLDTWFTISNHMSCSWTVQTLVLQSSKTNGERIWFMLARSLTWKLPCLLSLSSMAWNLLIFTLVLMGAYCGAVVVLHRLVFFVVRYLVNQHSEFSFDIRIKLIHDLFCLSVEPPSFDVLSFLSQVWKFGVQPIFHEEIFHIIIPNRLIWICILFECTNRLVCNQSQMFKMISTEHSSANGKKFSYQKNLMA